MDSHPFTIFIFAELTNVCMPVGAFVYSPLTFYYSDSHAFQVAIRVSAQG